MIQKFPRVFNCQCGHFSYCAPTAPRMHCPACKRPETLFPKEEDRLGKISAERKESIDISGRLHERIAISVGGIWAGAVVVPAEYAPRMIGLLNNAGELQDAASNLIDVNRRRCDDALGIYDEPFRAAMIQLGSAVDACRATPVALTRSRGAAEEESEPRRHEGHEEDAQCGGKS